MGSHLQYNLYIRNEIDKWIEMNAGIYTPQQANIYLQEVLIKSIKSKIYDAQTLGRGLNEHFRALL